MDSKKPFHVFTHIFTNLGNAERFARAVALPGQQVEIWQGGVVIARVGADTLKRTRIRMYG